jgi:hypothetical protein
VWCCSTAPPTLHQTAHVLTCVQTWGNCVQSPTGLEYCETGHWSLASQSAHTVSRYSKSTNTFPGSTVWNGQPRLWATQAPTSSNFYRKRTEPTSAILHSEHLESTCEWNTGDKQTISWRMPSSKMWHRVALVRTNILEDRLIIRVKRISELGIMLAVTSKYKSPLWKPQTSNLKSDLNSKLSFYWFWGLGGILHVVHTTPLFTANAVC